MQNFELVECYYDQIYICTVIVDLHLKISKIQCQLHTIFKRNKQNKLKMPCLSAPAGPSALHYPWDHINYGGKHARKVLSPGRSSD